MKTRIMGKILSVKQAFLANPRRFQRLFELVNNSDNRRVSLRFWRFQTLGFLDLFPKENIFNA
jgi:hypothetical protein